MLVLGGKIPRDKSYLYYLAAIKIIEKNIMNQKNLLLYLFFLFSIPLSAQESNIINLTVKDGLPSGEVYDMLQDSNGYLWIATEGGISRYDGYTFTQIKQKPEYHDISVIKLFTDYKGKIWFSTYSGNFGYIDKNIMRFHPLSYQIETNSRSFINNIFVDSTNALWLSSYNGFLYKSDSLQKKIICKERPVNEHIDLSFIPKGDQWVYQHRRPALFINDPSLRDSLLPDNFFSINKDKYEFRIHKYNYSPYHSYYCRIGEDDFLVSISEFLFRVKEGEIVKHTVTKSKKVIINIYKDQENKIWISVMENGIYRYCLNKLNNPELHLFADQTISSVIHDHESNLWFSSISKGLYFKPSSKFRIISSTKGEMINSLAFINNTIYYANFNKGLFKTKLNKQYTNRTESIQIENSTTDEISQLYSYGDQLFIIGTKKYYFSDTCGKSCPPQHDIYTINAINLQDDSIAWVIGDSSISRLDMTQNTINKYFEINTCNFRSIVEDSKGVIWIGSTDGLYSYHNGKLKAYHEENNIYSSRVNTLFNFKGGLLIGTTTSGLLFKRDSLLKNITTNEGLNSNNIKCLYIENDSTIWAGTNKGFNKIVFTNLNNFDYYISSFTAIDGLPAHEVNDIKKYKNQIYLATENGVVYFNPENFQKSDLTPHINFELFIINGSDTLPITNNEIILENNQNNIAIHYKAVGYRNQGKIIYRYLLGDNKQSIVQTTDLTARYIGLDPDVYSFAVKASFDGTIYSQPIVIKFRIKKHFTQTLVFKTLIVLIILITFYIITYFLLRGQRRKHEIRREILLSEQKALRTQINPHFFFNSLGSIQRFIVSNDVKVAQAYLNDFSSLVRLVLENSKHNFVFIDQEIKLIQLYLELEKKRFSNKFDYQIEIDDNIDMVEIRIPPLLIQPLVENAIWHGIMPKPQGGTIKLSFTMHDHNSSLLLCRISDSGIGREKSKAINQRRGKHYKSTGLANVKERINLINKVYKTNMKMEIIDLYDGNQNPKGTEVLLSIYYV